jgi:endonuclease/exonuclease/phosphatase family metal-dependent hydrolase
MRRVGEILDDCVDPDLTRGAESSSEKELRFFDGSYGIGLLSAQPLAGADRLELEAGHHPRAVIHAQIDAGDLPLHVFCTHLTPILRGIPHPTGGSWEAEQAAQVDALLAWVDAKAGDEPAIVLGDLNTGPAKTAIRARAPEHYARFVKAGFVNPYLEAQPLCSFCYENPVIRGKGDGLLIDHVLLRGFEGSADAKRFLDGRVELAIDGKRRPMALSDHYGIVVTLHPDP